MLVGGTVYSLLQQDFYVTTTEAINLGFVKIHVELSLHQAPHDNCADETLFCYDTQIDSNYGQKMKQMLAAFTGDQLTGIY